MRYLPWRRGLQAERQNENDKTNLMRMCRSTPFVSDNSVDITPKLKDFQKQLRVQPSKETIIINDSKATTRKFSIMSTTHSSAIQANLSGVGTKSSFFICHKEH